MRKGYLTITFNSSVMIHGGILLAHGITLRMTVSFIVLLGRAFPSLEPTRLISRIMEAFEYSLLVHLSFLTLCGK
jgi:hypothetical protein